MELPDELKKLEIDSLPLPIKLSDKNLPVNLNPFFYQVKFETSITSDENDKSLFPSHSTNIFGPKCSCNLNNRLRHNKETHADDSIERQILNQTKLKTKLTGARRKIILKEPVLKSVQYCYSHGRHKHCNSNQTVVSPTSNILSVLPSNCTNLHRLNLNDELGTKIMPSTSTTSTNVLNNRGGNVKFKTSTDEFLDFRNLIEECDIISSNCNLHEKNSTINKKSLKVFTKIQNRSNKKLHLKSKNCRVDTDDEDNINRFSSNSQSNINNQSSTSCSQQARINAASTTNCDVTIDELASYFETFVHIPKKMSSMAEMMYI